MLDDLAGLRRDPVGEEHLELHHQVASLGRALGQGQTLAPQPPHGARFDDVAARQRHHPVVECGDVNGAATESLETEKGIKSQSCRPVIFRASFIMLSEWPRYDWNQVHWQQKNQLNA